MSDSHKRHLESHTDRGVLVVTVKESQLRGDDLAEALRQELLALVNETEAKKVAFDLHNVTFVTSVTFRPLLSLRRRLQETGGHMVLCGLTPDVHEVFEATRLVTTSRSVVAPFEVRPDVESAIARLNEE